MEELPRGEVEMEELPRGEPRGRAGQHSTDAALARWRKVVGIVKNPQRRFRFTANDLTKRSEAAVMKRSNQVWHTAHRQSLVDLLFVTLLLAQIQTSEHWS